MSRKDPLPRRAFITCAAGATATLAAAPAAAPTQEAAASPREPADLPGTDLDDLARAVQGVLSSKRVGKPVFVRFTLHGPAKAEEIVPRLAGMVAAVRQWVGEPLARLYAIGSPRTGQVSLTLQFQEGASALVSYARGKPTGDGIDFLLLGNHGSVCYDSGTGLPWDATARPGKEPPDPKLATAIERAVRSGRPVTLGTGGEP
jgi:hypothetical protein